MIVSIINEKGGSGKSTLAVNLSAKLAEDKDKVLLIDNDPQNSTHVFCTIREEMKLEKLFDSILQTELNEKEISKLNYDSIIIDTGGRDSKEMRKAMLFSDIIIIPTIASQYDVSVLDHMLKLYKEVKKLNPKLLALVLINRISPNPFLIKELQNLIEYINATTEKNDFQDLFLLSNPLYERQAYKRAVSEGKSIGEFCHKNDKAYHDFEQFYQEVLQIATEYFKG